MNKKDLVRKSPEWKRLRDSIYQLQKGKDYITDKQLPKGWHCHHLDPKHYDDLSIEKFVGLGSSIHKVVHRLYIYYKKDPTVINRLVEVLNLMLIYEIE